MLSTGPRSLLVKGMVPLLARATLFDGPAPASGLLNPPLFPSQVMVKPGAGVRTTRGLAARTAVAVASAQMQNVPRRNQRARAGGSALPSRRRREGDDNQ